MQNTQGNQHKSSGENFIEEVLYVLKGIEIAQ